MQKAYELKDLIEIFKTNGLDIAEEAAEAAVLAMFEWLEKSALMSENKYDDLCLAVLPLIKPLILKQVDRIDGKHE